MASRFMIVNKSLDKLEFNQFILEPGGSTVVESRDMHNDPAYPKYLALQKITLVEYVESGITKEMNGRGMIKRGVVSATVPAVEDKTQDSTEPSLTSKQEEEKAEEEPPAPAPEPEPVTEEVKEVLPEPTPEPLPVEEEVKEEVKEEPKKKKSKKQ